MNVNAQTDKIEQEVRNLINEFDTQNQQQWLLEAQKYLADKSFDEKEQSIRLMREDIKIRKRPRKLVRSNLIC